MKNIHLLATENYKQDYTLQSGEVVKVVRLGQLIINKEYNELSVNKNPQWSASCDTDVLVPHHIYITSDEEIKEGDWVYRFNSKDIFKVDSFLLHLLKLGSTETCKKIILTTDQDLIADGVQAIDDEFLEWFVKNPSCEFIEVKDANELLRAVAGGVKFYKIIIPQEYLTKEEEDTFFVNHVCGIQEESKQILCGEANKFYRCITCDSPCGSEGHYIEEPKKSNCLYDYPEKCENSECRVLNKCNGEYANSKKETIEEAAERLIINPTLEDKQVFKEGAKWMAKRSYSEEEVLEMITMARKICCIDGSIDLDDDSLQGNLEGFGMKYTINQILEQFKKNKNGN
jgi:hypothetical protein